MTERHVRVTIERHPAPGALERAVADFVGVDPSEVVLDARCDDCGRPHGKPRVIRPRAQDGSEIVVSKSSAAGLVAIAVSGDGAGGDLGIDVESERRMTRSRVDEVAFGAGERDLIDDEPPATRDRLRTRLWSRKEAYLKATGQGVRLDLTTIDVASGPLSDAVIVDVAVDGLGVEPDLVLSVAMLGNAPVVVEVGAVELSAAERGAAP